MQEHIKAIIQAMGEDPNREGLKKTPERVERAYQFFTKGYAEDPYELIKGATFPEKTNSMVVVKDIELYSLCEHHLLPFIGKCHVGYVPKDRIVGLSKIPRLVEIYARRLQMQERLTDQVAQTLFEILMPRGVAVVVEATHLCMQMRGVEKQGSTMITSCMLGSFRDNMATRTEFMDLIRHKRD